MTVKDCFNIAAGRYDQHCQLQLTTGDKLLSLIEPAETIIDLGCGTGIVTSKLQYNKLYALDLSDKMLESAKLRLGDENIIYLEKSFDNFNGLELDLAFANMSLQWSEDLNKTLANIKANLKPGGILAFSIPITGTFEGVNIPTIYFHDFEQIKDLLLNWQVIHSFSQSYNYSFSSLVEALKSIKAVGANYCTSHKKSVIPREKTPQILKYNIAYFVARK
jgi:malonyl-CoA O-methyltransferase